MSDHPATGPLPVVEPRRTRLRSWYLGTLPGRAASALAALLLVLAAWSGFSGCQDVLLSSFPPECALYANGHIAAGQLSVLLAAAAVWVLVLAAPPRR